MERATRLLVVVRHAKAESGEEGSDHDRRLTPRGESEAADTGRWLAGRLDRLDHVWVSSATRAQQTWAALRAALPPAAEVVVASELYQAGAREVLAHVAATDVPVVLVVGHNPTMERAVMALTGDLHGLRPAAAALVELDGTTGRLLDLHAPAR